jgi:hypothetical protein
MSLVDWFKKLWKKRILYGGREPDLDDIIVEHYTKIKQIAEVCGKDNKGNHNHYVKIYDIIAEQNLKYVAADNITTIDLSSAITKNIINSFITKPEQSYLDDTEPRKLYDFLNMDDQSKRDSRFQHVRKTRRSILQFMLQYFVDNRDICPSIQDCDVGGFKADIIKNPQFNTSDPF